MRFGIQLYTLRDLEESLPETIERVGDTDFEGVQLSGFGNATPEAVAGALETSGLDLAGAHVGLEALRDDLEGTLAAYETVDCEAFVVPSHDEAVFRSESGAREAGAELASLATALPDEASLHYHNHTFEFTPLGEGTAFDAFAEAATGVGLEIDTGLANHAGVDPVELLERYGDRTRLVHLTDSRAGEADTRHMDLGTGEVDLAGCLDACAEAGVEWVLFEHGLTDDPIASMEGAAETLTELRGRDA